MTRISLYESRDLFGMASSKSNIAIIGAGLSGLTLGLALHQVSIPCTIYESRPAPMNIGGAVMLSPNALKVLDALGLYERIKIKGYNFELLEFKDAKGTLLETYEFGGQDRYGYKGLRIYRHVLIDEIVGMLKEKGITVNFGMKFSHVVSETEDEVRWEMVDGSVLSASALIGADGNHSTVRRYLYPDLRPKFTGMAGITAAVPTDQLNLPPGYHIPATIMTKLGAFVIAPQEVDGSEVLIGKQKHMQDQDKEGWERTLAGKDTLVDFLQQDAEAFPTIVQNAVSKLPHNKTNVWPFYIIPRLDKWTSKHRRVIILGDAAHAIPPSAGQGINQAFEDVYMFALLLAKAEKDRTKDALSFWQEYRQQRIDKVMALNAQIDLRRMPHPEKTSDMVGNGNGAVSKQEIELGWLYEPDFNAVVEDWLVGRAKASNLA